MAGIPVANLNELLVLIASHIPYRADLRSLCLVCRRLCDATLPVLYEDLRIAARRTAKEDILDCVVDSLERIPLRRLRYTKHVCLYTVLNRPSRCIHDVSKVTGVPMIEEEEEEKVYGRLLRALDVVLSAIPKDALLTFRWDMKSCLPQDLFSNVRGLMGNQRHVRALEFHTDVCCSKSTGADYPIDVSCLQNLQSLTWRGPRQGKDFELIRKCLRSSSNIKTLNLALWWYEEDEEFISPSFLFLKRRDKYLIRDVLGIQEEGMNQPLPSLETLSLGPVSFYGMEADIACALNLERLRTLKLQNCPGCFGLLEALAESTKKPLRLTTLEITLNLSINNRKLRRFDNIPAAFSRFLRAFHSLENLFLFLPKRILAGIDADAILNNHPGLRRLLIHGFVYRELTVADSNGVPDNLFQPLLTGSSIMCVGARLHVRTMIERWKKLSPRPLCKLLHLRVRPDPGFIQGPEPITQNRDRLINTGLISMLDFTKWAFSDDGLPELQVLAWGMFSRDTPLDNNMLFCRSEDGFKPLTRADVYAWDFFQQNMDMLTLTHDQNY
ncbi:conserved hypothetical protein [Microsporum canis CBS 113480]|uniref:F-box domain-containing protein n=1 Tax=Arthroderma otae (strain ATCC MYA-4605 / CBS 113480) TaxID=554155 RepID=C5FXT7_ARTOC|nr:conserved hypothetical protein [Microsporum canis CBS 113480]EEQ35127.1 conserved hypothetical protein [Microsporum canis CBS 113480]